MTDRKDTNKTATISTLAGLIGVLLGLLVSISAMKPDLEVFKAKCLGNERKIEKFSEEYENKMNQMDEKLDKIILELQNKEDRK